MKILFILVLCFASIFAAPNNSKRKSSRQADAGQTITLVNNSTPAVISPAPETIPTKEVLPALGNGNVETGSKPELVPTVVDTNPALPISGVTTVRPNSTSTDNEDNEDESSEEEEEGNEENDEDDQENDEDSENSDEENSEERKLYKKSGLPSESNQLMRDTYIPGYITEEGELLVPIDTVQRDLQYTIIEDPNFKHFTKARKVGDVSGKVPTPIKPQNESEESEKIAIPTKNSVIFKEKESSVEESKESSEEEDEEDEGEEEVKVQPVNLNQKPPLAAVPARTKTNEDDERDSNIKARRYETYDYDEKYTTFY